MSQVTEHANFWHAPDFGNMELLHATYVTHAFDRHIHEGYAIGVIERGAEGFYYRGEENVVAAEGCAVVINPGEIHTGQAMTEHGWTYRMFYPGVVSMRALAMEMTGRPWDMPYFNDAVIWDAQIVRALWRMHRVLEVSKSKLERETAIRDGFGALLLRHAANRPLTLAAGHERTAVRRARDYLEAHYNQNTSLESLAAEVGLSPYHLLRVFKQEVGVPPHTYRNHLRIERAKGLLLAGVAIADVAAQTGFTDQSHLTRRFKRVVGVPPGQYV